MISVERLEELRKSRHIERIPYGVQSQPYLDRARRLLDTADREMAVNPEVAMTCSYEAMLSCGLAVLASHGYRLTGRPGHHAVLADIVNDAVAASAYQASGLAYVRLRRLRNQSLYEAHIVDQDTAEHAKTHGEALLEWAKTETSGM